MSFERINVPRKVSFSLKTVKRALISKLFGQVAHVEMLAAKYSFHRLTVVKWEVLLFCGTLSFQLQQNGFLLMSVSWQLITSLLTFMQAYLHYFPDLNITINKGRL